jgi:inner membrane protein
MAHTPMQARSLGLKILAVGLIVVLLAIPLMFVNLLSWERTGRADSVRAEVGETYGGSQIIRGPYLLLPVLVETPIERRENGETRSEIRRSRETIIISADQLDLDISQTSEIRRRAIYDVPVFNASLSFSGHFVLPDLLHLTPENGTILWQQAEVVLAVSDLRAIGNQLLFEIDGQPAPLTFEPGTGFDRQTNGPLIDGMTSQLARAGRWQGVSAAIPALSPDSRFSFSGELQLTGADALMVSASGRDTRVSIQSDWPHPSFVGAYLPAEREISADGFSANWQIPYLARGVPGAWLQGQFDIRDIDRTAFGVRLFSPTDGYTNVSRSLKYAIFFIGFLMLMFFLIEAASRDRIHVAQYILVGLAQVVFYLLLLAFTEHMPTFAAYVTASTATVLVTAFYAAAAFGSRARGLATFAVLAVIYSLQYVLVLLEDYALLIGSVFAFLAVALTMYITRGLDWYGLSERKPVS